MNRPLSPIPSRAALLTALLLSSPALAASFGELSDGFVTPPQAQVFSAGPYSGAPNGTVCPPCMPGQLPYGAAPAAQAPYGAAQPLPTGAEGTPPAALDAPGAAMLPPPSSPNPYLPVAPHGGGPHGQVQLWTFGQVNATTDPFNPWGLSTPFMFVPWSTPLSGWSNAQTWNWWRERSGALPRNW